MPSHKDIAGQPHLKKAYVKIVEDLETGLEDKLNCTCAKNS